MAVKVGIEGHGQESTAATGKALHLWLLLALGLATALAFAATATSAAAAPGCFAKPSACGLPDATNTGVPPGTALTASGSRTLSTDGQVLDGVELTGTVTVTADNVTIRNSRLATTSSGEFGVITLAKGADNFTLEDSEVGGNGSTTNAPQSNVWNHYNNPGARMIRSYVHGTPDNWEGRVDLIKDSYMVVDAARPGSHDENIYIWCSTLNVDHSTLINHHEQTATVFGDTIGCDGNQFTLTNSLLAGGGFIIYPQSAGENHPIPDAQTTVTGNRFARCLGPTKYNSKTGGTTCEGGADANGVFPQGGYFGLRAAMNGPVTWSGNVWDDNSQPICLGSCSTPPPPDAPAVATWTAPSGVIVGTAVNLDGRASTGDAPISCTWTFENQSGSTVLDTRTGCQISYTFQQAGTQYVRLTVTDGDGDTSFNRRSFAVAAAPTPPPPDAPAVATWTAPSGVIVGTAVNLDGRASTGDAPISCTWTFENQSGSTVLDTRTGCQISYTFQQAGTQYVRLTVTDGDGDTSFNRRSFAVAAAPTPPPPDAPAVATWTAPSGVIVGTAVNLDGRASTGDAPISCTWTFENQSGSTAWESHGGCRIDFTFQQPGVKYVRLTVTDGDGDIDSSRREFLASAPVSNPPPEGGVVEPEPPTTPPVDQPAPPVTPPQPPSPPPPAAGVPLRALWSAPDRVLVGEWIVLDGNASRGQGPLVCTWTIETRNGVPLGQPRNGCRSALRFDQSGTQYIRLTVRDSSGSVASLRQAIRVRGLSPTMRSTQRETRPYGVIRHRQRVP